MSRKSPICEVSGQLAARQVVPSRDGGTSCGDGGEPDQGGHQDRTAALAKKLANWLEASQRSEDEQAMASRALAALVDLGRAVDAPTTSALATREELLAVADALATGGELPPAWETRRHFNAGKHRVRTVIDSLNLE